MADAQSMELKLVSGMVLNELSPQLSRLRGGRPVNLKLDLADYEFAEPHSTALVAAAVELLNQEERLAALECIPPRDSDVHRYLSRVDFYDRIGMPDLADDIRRHDPSGRFVELKTVTFETCSSLSREIAEIVAVRTTDWSDLLVGIVETCLMEILDNACIHAESPTNPLVTAQSYRDHIEIAVVDCGIGIATSLRTAEKYAKLSDQQAVLRAFDQKVSRTEDPIRGNGLWFTRELARESGGFLQVYTNGVVYTTGLNFDDPREAPRWTGTLMRLRIGKGRVPDVDEIFKDIGGVPATILDRCDGWF